jgi:hypothetical protein
MMARSMSPVVCRLKPRCWLAIVAWVAGGLHAQTVSLTLSSAAVPRGRAAILHLSLNALDGVPPAALQWTFQYPSSGLTNFTVEDGPAVAAVEKTVICSGNATAYKCLAVGHNAETIPNGIVARIRVVLASDASATTIQITDALGTSVFGSSIPVSAAGGTITPAKPSPLRKVRPPIRRSAGGAE